MLLYDIVPSISTSAGYSSSRLFLLGVVESVGNPESESLFALPFSFAAGSDHFFYAFSSSISVRSLNRCIILERKGWGSLVFGGYLSTLSLSSKTGQCSVDIHPSRRSTLNWEATRLARGGTSGQDGFLNFPQEADDGDEAVLQHRILDCTLGHFRLRMVWRAGSISRGSEGQRADRKTRYLQASNQKLAGLNTLTFSVWMSRGAGLVLTFDATLILVTVCRTIMRVLRPKIRFIPLDENLWFHRQLAYAMLVFTIVHTSAHYVK